MNIGMGQKLIKKAVTTLIEQLPLRINYGKVFRLQLFY